jgi:hypothetical protein
MAPEGKPKTPPSSPEALYSRRCAEAATLREELSKDRIFKIHTESVLVRRSRLKIAAEKNPELEKRFTYFFVSLGLIAVAVCFTMKTTFGVPILGISLLALVISIILLWNQDHLRDSLTCRMPEEPWQLFDSNMLSPEAKGFTRQLRYLLDHAKTTTER